MGKQKNFCPAVAIIGSGVAGLYTALCLPESVSIALLTKAKLNAGSTRFAQGGIAVALPPRDSPAKHLQDTLAAGAGLVHKKAAQILVQEAPACIQDLINLGMHFDQEAGTLLFTQEAAHGIPRIIHAGGDATGNRLEQFLIKKIKSRKNITVLENAIIFDVQQPKYSGLQLAYFATQTKKIQTLDCSLVVIATGGCGQVFLHTTNHPHSTGDGLLLAQQCGLVIKDMEFYQFHPTALRPGNQPLQQRDFLISEAVRGEGGVLLNNQKKRFMPHYDPRAELAPRDVVTRAIWDQMNQTHNSSVYLDISHLPKNKILKRFPTIYHQCLKHHLNITTEPIPVSPTAHYQIGGIVTNTRGQTSHHLIYATGEVACTGVHGANRLASNSLLESLVFSRRAAHDMEKKLTTLPACKTRASLVRKKYQHIANSENKKLATLKKTIKQLMWHKVGIIRKTHDLEVTQSQLKTIQTTQAKLLSLAHPRAFETKSLLVTAQLITTAALHRKKSVGAHYRID